MYFSDQIIDKQEFIFFLQKKCRKQEKPLFIVARNIILDIRVRIRSSEQQQGVLNINQVIRRVYRVSSSRPVGFIFTRIARLIKKSEPILSVSTKSFISISRAISAKELVAAAAIRRCQASWQR